MEKREIVSKILGILLVFAMLTSTPGGVVWARESDVVGAGYVDVSVEQAKEMIDSDIRVLDVRTENEYGAGHIAGAELVPLSELEQRTGELDKDDALLVYCKSGTRNAEASNILIQHEFESVYNMEGGINAWVNAGYPVVSSSIGDQSGQGCLRADSQIATTSSKPIVDELEQEYAQEVAFIHVESQDERSCDSLRLEIDIIEKNELPTLKNNLITAKLDFVADFSAYIVGLVPGAGWEALSLSFANVLVDMAERKSVQPLVKWVFTTAVKELAKLLPASKVAVAAFDLVELGATHSITYFTALEIYRGRFEDVQELKREYEEKGCYEEDGGSSPDEDHPDESYDFSDLKITLNNPPDPEVRPQVVILFKGFPKSAAELLASFGEPSTFVDIGFSPDLLGDYPILIIPSGGLYGLDSSPSFKSNLEEYVENGGALIVFSQQHGYEYNALPGGEVSGYGWLEDQSCHHSSVGINNYHPMLSGQDSVVSDLAVDGFLTSYPDNATVLLSRTKNGMPAMLWYEYGDGQVIATTAYTDWAYGKGQATQDGINLVRDMIAWAKAPVEIPEYGASDTVDSPVNVFNMHLPIPEVEYHQYAPGDVVSIPLEITNLSDDQTSDRVIFSIFNSDYEMEDITVSVSIPPGETTTVDFTYETTESSKTGVYLVLYSLYAGETMIGGGFVDGFGVGVDISELSTYKINFTLIDPDKNIIQEETATLTVPAGGNQTASFTYANPSKLGIWGLEYEIVDYNGTVIGSGVKRFAVSDYAENPDGWVYRGENLQVWATSPSQRVVRGSLVPFTIHVKNDGDTNFEGHIDVFGHEQGGAWWTYYDTISNITVPQHSQSTFSYSHEMRYSTSFYFHLFYSYGGGPVADTELGIWIFDPSIDVDIATDKPKYSKGEGVSIFLDLRNKQDPTYDVSATVRVLDPENIKIFEDAFDVTLTGGASDERTFSFSLPSDAKYGVYVVSAEAYVEDKKVGSGSTYFEVIKGCIVRVSFDHPNKAYRAREGMTVYLEAINVVSIPWSLTVDISIPDLYFNDSVDFTLDPGETEEISCTLSIPADIAVGNHDIIVTIPIDDSTEEYYFFVPESELVLDVNSTSYGAGEDLSISLTNAGGVDTTCDCSMEFYDPQMVTIYQNSFLEGLLAGESKELAFTIPDQAVNGDYYLMASCEDLSTNKLARLSKSITVDGLEASLTSVADKKAYFNDEVISIQTEITNLDGEIVDGVLNLKIVRPRSLEEEGWIRNPANGHYYKLTTPMDWLQAEAQAVEWGGHLVTVNDRDEELWLREQFSSQEHFWIGFNDLDVESSWGWVSGEPISYTNWAEGEPNNYQEEDAAVMNWAHKPELYGDSWNDEPISEQYRGIVEASLENAHQISEHTNITPGIYTASPSGSTSWAMASIAAKKNVVASDLSNEAWILPRQDSASSRDYDRVTNVYTNDLANFYTSSGIKDTYVASDYTSLKHIQQASELAEEYMPKPTPVPVAGYQRGVVSPNSLMSGRDRAWERTAADASRNIYSIHSDHGGINPFNNAMLRYESVASDPRVTSYIPLSSGGNGSISGFVYKGDGVTLIEGATVKVQNWDAEFFQFVAESTTNATGAYVISGLDAGEYRVLASATERAYELYHETYLWDEAQPVSVTEGEDTPNINFSLGPGGTISGLITSADSGVPLSQVSVLASYADNSPVGGWALSDPSGNYTINSLPYGTYIVRSPSDWRFGTSDDGYLMEFWQEKSNWDDADTVTVSEVVYPTDIDFTLEVGGIISGVVEDEVGDPIEGAWIYASGDDVSGWGSNQSVEDGSYTITGLPTGNYRVYAQAPGYIREYYDDVYDWSDATLVSVNAPNDTPNIDFTMEVGGTISGIVDDEFGDPIEGAWIYASGDDVSGWGGNQSTEDGSYTITGLPSGSYRVYAQAPGYIREYYDDVYDWSDATLVSVNAPNDTPNIDFTLEVGGTISGVVEDEAGDPIEGAWVYASDYDGGGWGESSYTAEDGSYTITGLPSGSYRVQAQAPGYIREYYDDVYDWSDATLVSVTATDDTPNINFSLEVGGTISGVVKDESGVPIPDLHVYAEDYNRGDWMGGTNTNPDGSYTITGLPTGTHRVKACASCSGLQYVDEFYDDAYHWRWETATPVSVTAPNDTPNIDFTLEISGFISGTVLDQNTGEPLDATCESVNLDIGWHKFVYRHEEYEGGQASRAAFKAPGDTDWRWFSTSELMVSISLEPDAESGILLCNKKNTWEYNPGNHAELVACVDVDSTEEDGWYGCSIVDAVNQDGNIHGNDEYFTSYYEGYFYVETAGTWYFSTDSDDASEIVIDDHVVSYWYGGHGPANMWEQRGGITAYWYDTDEWVDYMNVNTDGSYTLGNLPSGSYIVEATATGYIHEYYEESVSWDEATTVIVAAPNTSTNVSFTLERGGTISGVVKDEVGEPIPNVHVDAESYDTGGEMHDADTDQYGYYIITEVLSGTYRVRACSSCDGLPYLDEYYDDTYYYDEATPVSVTAPDDTPGINFNLAQGGSISGHVYEDDGVTPIPNCDVNTETLDGEHWRSSQTDSNGNYIIIGLFSGDYKVNAQCEPYAREFWEEKTRWDEADIVSVTAPNDTPNIDFTLEVGGTISGHVYESDGITPIPNMHIQADDYETGCGVEGANTDEDGAYSLLVRSGTYRVRACSSCSGLPYIDEFYDDTYYYGEAIPVSVTAPDDTTNIDFVLEVGGTISGYVYEEDGVTPIPNCNVYAEDYDTGIGMGGTSTDENGSYTISNLPTGTYQVWACGRCEGLNYIDEWYDDTYDEDEATPVSVTAPDDTPGINFNLAQGGSISGHVYEADGVTPIPNCDVHAGTLDGEHWRSSQTDSNGNYIIIGLFSGDYKVNAQCEPYAREFWEGKTHWDEADIVSVTAPNDTPNIDFTLEVGGTISGHIYEADGITPIPNVDVDFWPFDTSVVMENTNTDEDGAYSILLPSGTYRVRACSSCCGLPYIDEWYDDTYYYDEATPVSVTAPDDTPNINFNLEVGGTISGHVYQEDGVTPIPNCNVYAEDYNTGIRMGGTGTDENGSYSIIGLSTGTYQVWACGRCEGLNYIDEWYDNTYDEDEATPVSVTAPDDTPNINFSLEIGGTISGHVYQEDGVTPIPNCGVNAETLDGEHWRSAQTDSNGSYSIIGLRSGGYTVNAQCDPYAREFWEEKTHWDEADIVSVTAPNETSGIDFTLEVGGTISGHVYQEDGVTPIPNCNIYAEDYDTGVWMDGTNTNQDGSYSLVLPSGTYQIWACGRCEGLNYIDEWYDDTYDEDEATPVSVTAPDDTPNINFNLEVGGTISGHVYQEDGVTPIADCSVCSHTADGEQGWCTDTDLDGSYTIIGLPDGEYKVNAQCDPYARELWEEKTHWDEADIVNVTAPNETSGIDFTLEIGGTISGNVYQEDGVTPIPNLHVYAEDYDTGVWMEGTNTNLDGSYSLVLPTGTYQIGVCPSCSGLNYVREWYDGTYYRKEAVPVSVTAPNDTPNIDFTLEVGGTISGMVEDGEGNPVEGAYVYAEVFNNGFGNDAETDSEGQYTIYGLPSGEYRVEAEAEDFTREFYDGTYYREEAIPVAVTAPDDTPNIDFTLEVGGTISGYIYKEDGVTPLSNCYVYAEDYDMGVWMADTDTNLDGSYSLVLPTGTYQVGVCPSCSGLNYVREWYDGTYYEPQATAVPVTAPDDTPGINFTLEIGGTISGHVYQEDGVTPIPNIDVYAEDYDTGVWMDGTNTNQDGSYSLVLPSGTYRVFADASDYVSEYYDGVYYMEWGAATPVSVTAPDDTPNIDFTLEVGGTISGHIYEADGITPIPNVDVVAEDYDSNIWMADTSTDQDGSYSLVLPSGTYRVYAIPSRPGPNYISEFYDGIYYEPEATPVAVTAPNDTSGIDLTLELGGTISGHVYREDGITLLPNACIGVMDYDTWVWMEGTSTDEDGSYSLILPTGTYRVRASGICSDLNYVSKWYEDTYDGDQATVVSVSVPSDTSGIDFILEPGGIISGHVYQEDGVTPIPGVHIYAEDYDTGVWMEGTSTDHDGHYLMILPAGTYQVGACPACSHLDYAGFNYIREWYDNTYYEQLATPVPVTVPDETSGIDFWLEIGGTISGHVYREDGVTPIINIELYAEDYGMDIWMENAHSNLDGSYSLVLPTGTYRVWACPSCTGLDYYDEWYDGTPDREEAAPVPVVAPNETAGIDFTLTRPTLTLTPSSGGVGTFVTVNGSDMTPSSVILVGSLTFADIPWNAMDIPIDSAGNILPTTLIVPMVGPGPHTVTATDGAGVTARATFWVTAIVWEEDISVNMSALEFLNLITDISIPTEMPGTTGKLDLIATLYSSSSQIINQSDRYSIFIFDQDLSLTLETHKEVYKPNETIMVFGEVQNNSEIAGSFNLSVSKDEEEIFADSFTLDPGEIHSYTTNISSNSSFTLEATVDGVTITDFVSIESPSVNVSILAPDVVGLTDFDIGVLVENVASIDSDIHVSLADKVWDMLIAAGESRLLETTMNITQDTTLDVVVSGDVEKTVQKEIIMGEGARIAISPQTLYLEGLVEIPFTVENTKILDTEFEATFSINDQVISKALFVPQGQSITDTLSFDLTQGEHILRYSSPFEEGNVDIHVGVPEFVVTELPSNLNLTWGQEVTWTFKVGNVGGAEGEAYLYLMLPDFEETKFTWVMPGHEEEISFDFTVPDDLEEKEYKAIYELDGSRDEFTFFVQGAKVIVDASLDEPFYEDGETAVLTLDVTNDCSFDLSLYARTQLHEYEEIQPFELTDSETLQFSIPVTFNGNKLFYGIYMESGRALYLNSMYVHQKRDIISLYTDKQVYLTGETVTVFVNTTQSGTLNITAPGYAEELTIAASTVLTFAVPELRSGTYHIDYTFDGFSSSYPFDVIGYSARIVEFELDKESYSPGELILMEANIEVNRDVAGLLRVRIYGPEYDALDEFDVPVTLVQGENVIKAERIFLSDGPGIHSLVYQLFGDLAGHSLVLLSSGAEYFDGISATVDFQLSLKAGWNMVSVPVTPADNSTSAVFPGVAGVFTWNATSRSYYEPTVIDPEKGYWVAVTENTTIAISGTPIETWTTDIKAGWNMVGSVITIASIFLPNDDPDGSVITPAYWWNPVSKSYILTTDIEPGKGYWVASTNDCLLTL